MKKLVKKIAIVLMNETRYQEREDFFHHIIKRLQTHRCTPVPGFYFKDNSPTIEAVFDVGIFVESVLDKNDGLVQITIVCRALHLRVEDLCQYLPPSSVPKLLAKIAGQPNS